MSVHVHTKDLASKLVSENQYKKLRILMQLIVTATRILFPLHSCVTKIALLPSSNINCTCTCYVHVMYMLLQA